MSDQARRYELPELQSSARGRAQAVPPTMAELESIQAQAYAEGWQKGHAEGYAAGAEDMERARERVQWLVMALAEPLDACDESLQQQLRELVASVGAVLARHTLQAVPEAVAELVRDAVVQLGQAQGTAHVALHPMDRASLPEGFVLPEGVQWHDDPELKRGDVRAWREAKGIDGSLQARLDLLCEEWLEAELDVAKGARLHAAPAQDGDSA